MSTCTKCLQKEATLRCKMCHRPICKECRTLTAKGVFCSEKCDNEFANFQKRVEKSGERPVRKRIKVPRFIKFLLFVVVILAIFYFVFGVKNLEQLKQLINSLISKFR